MNDILVAQLFWWHSGILYFITHCNICNPIPLCQNKLGTKRNTAPNSLNCIYFNFFDNTNQLTADEPK